MDEKLKVDYDANGIIRFHLSVGQTYNSAVMIAFQALVLQAEKELMDGAPVTVGEFYDAIPEFIDFDLRGVAFRIKIFDKEVIDIENPDILLKEGSFMI